MSGKNSNEGRSVLYYFTMAAIFAGFVLAACQTGAGL